MRYGLLLAAFVLLLACVQPAFCTVRPEPCTLNPDSSPAPCTEGPKVPRQERPCNDGTEVFRALHAAPSSSGRGLIFSFDMQTESDTYVANVSNPTVPSVQIVIIVRNNATAPLSVRLSATINLGGTVGLDPEQTALIPYHGTSSSVASVTLPENTTSDSMGYLEVNGVCDQNPTVTYSVVIRISINQWHQVRLDRFALSTSSPVEKEPVQLSGEVVNAGNGPSDFIARAFCDGSPLEVRVNGNLLEDNDTVRLTPGRSFAFSATWPAVYGNHNFFVEVSDVGPGGMANASTAYSKVGKVAGVFVGVNYKDWIPYLMVLALALVIMAVVVFRFRKRIRPRLARMRRRMRRRKGEEAPDAEGYEEEAPEAGEEEEPQEEGASEEADGQEDEEGAEEEEQPPARPLTTKKGGFLPAAKKPATRMPVRAQASSRKPAAPARRPAAPAGRTAAPAGKYLPTARRSPPPARPKEKIGIIVVGDAPEPEERPEAPPTSRAAGAKSKPEPRKDEEE